MTIEEDLGVFEPFKPQIYRIEEGFRNAVAEEVKSQRMKSELITNVSHDLKTPLTAIITYVKLLQEPGVTQEQRLAMECGSMHGWGVPGADPSYYEQKMGGMKFG